MKTLVFFITALVCVSAQNSPGFIVQGFADGGNFDNQRGFGNRPSAGFAPSAHAHDEESVKTKYYKLTRKDPIVKNFYYAYAVPESNTKNEENFRIAYQPEVRTNNVFIKVPGQNSFETDSNINLGPQIEERTKVYVLIKDQGDRKNVNDIDVPLPGSVVGKPEIVFVRYKDEKKHQGLDVVSNIQVVGEGNIDEETLNAGIIEAGGLRNIATAGGGSSFHHQADAGFNDGGFSTRTAPGGAGVVRTVTRFIQADSL